MRELSGRAVLGIVFTFFAVIIGVNAVFIVEAASTFRGEDEQRPYLQGIEFNKTIAERAQQALLGWNATLAVRRDASGQVHILVTVHDKGGQPLSHLELVGELRHPADAARDRRTNLVENNDGSYSGTLSGVAPGNWDVLIRAATPNNVAFEADRRVWLP